MKKVTTSLLLWESQATFLHDAAQKEGMNVSQFIRDRVIPLLAHKYSMPVPEVPTQPRQIKTQSGIQRIDVNELQKMAETMQDLLKQLKGKK